MKKISLRAIYIYILVATIIFQDTLVEITKVSLINFIDELIVLCLIVLGIISIVRNKKINKLSGKLLIFLIIFSIEGIISCYINSSFILKDVLMSNFLSIKFFLIIFSILNIKFNPITIKYMKESVIFYSNIVMFFAVFNFILPNLHNKIFPFVMQMYRFGLPSVCSIFRHPGTYGWFMFLVSLYYYSNYSVKKDKEYLKKFIITAIFAILSFRVKVIMGIIVVLIYSIIFNNRKKIKLEKVIIILIIVCVILFISYDLLEYTYLMYFTNEFGESARKSLTVNSINILKTYFPIGVGFGKFGSWYARIKYSEYYYIYDMTRVYGLNPENPFFATDTYWPSILGETGFLGTSIYLYLFYLIFKNLKNKLRYKLNDDNKVIVMWGLFIFIQSLVESTSEAIYNNSPQYILIGVIISLALSRNITNKRRKNIE